LFLLLFTCPPTCGAEMIWNQTRCVKITQNTSRYFYFISHFYGHQQFSPQLTTSLTELPQSQNKSYEPLSSSQNTPLQLGMNCFYIPHSMPWQAIISSRVAEVPVATSFTRDCFRTEWWQTDTSIMWHSITSCIMISTLHIWKNKYTFHQLQFSCL